jgi:phenylpropionate dioxygenase-like ring-hydroxylating dioxygenase large terminal subunit
LHSEHRLQREPSECGSHYWDWGARGECLQVPLAFCWLNLAQRRHPSAKLNLAPKLACVRPAVLM